MTKLHTATLGAILVVLYTGLISSADAITKLIAGGYAAPQLYCLSAVLVMAMCVVVDRHKSQQKGFATSCPKAMALRSAATVVAAVSFFYAFQYLPFADVFLFIALMPILAACMSTLILRERASPSAWLALGAGVAGVLCLFPSGLTSVSMGHAFALSAAIFGTLSMIMARYIGRFESNALAQVFYPNAAIFVSMGIALPFVWSPMPLVDLGWVGLYAIFLFAARWVVVVALRLLAAYVVTPLMNLQFVWMLIMGAAFFGEQPGVMTCLGAAVVIGSGIYLVWDQLALPLARAFRMPVLRPRGLRSDP